MGVVGGGYSRDITGNAEEGLIQLYAMVIVKSFTK